MRTLFRNSEHTRLIGLSSFLAPIVLGILMALAFGGGSKAHLKPAFAVPVPIPVYEIEADGGPNYSHHASLLNLKLGQPGVLPQVPMPVDTDGDLLPDVTVAVNLVNIDGRFLNPPQIGQILAPNIEINRLITTPILGQKSYPLKIDVKLTVKDITGSTPDTVVRFGYDTGPGGSIPNYWKATVGGLQDFFNPIQAVIDTTGQQFGLHPGITDFRLGPIAAPYQGPLKIIGGVQTGDTNADINIAYRPFPGAIGMSYGTDDAGQHITYAHGVDSEVDMTSTLKLATADSATNVVARIDRLPRSMSFDVNQNATGGGVDYHSVPNSRLPDAQVDVTTTSPGEAPLVARADIESLPAAMHGEWSIKDAQPAHVAFNASGTGVGAIEARVANYSGTPTKLKPWVPTQQQYASFQSVPITGGTEQLIMGRAERLRNITFDQQGAGYTGHLAIGDGELPFVANIGLDQRPDGPLVSGQAQVSPLPDSMDMSFSPPGADPTTDPLKVSYDASQSTDVDAHVEVRLPDAADGAACGADQTICADLSGRNLPAHIEARVRDGLTTADGQPETRIELDDVPRPGGVQPDFHAHIIVGQNDLAPLIADADLDGLSRFVRMRAVQGLDETLQRMELHTCDYDYSNSTCAPGTEDEVGAVRVNVRDFVNRPANLPPPASPAPSFAGVTARGDANVADLVRFEAVGRMNHVREIQYVNAGGTFGARTRVGGGKNLAVDVDIAGITMAQFPDNRIDLAAHALITPLPDTINLCVQNGGGQLIDGTDPVVAACQKKDPFRDHSVDAAPLVFDWQASSPFSTVASGRVHLDEGTPNDPTDDLTIGGNVKVDNIPSALNAIVALPVGGQSGGPIRVLTTGPAGTNIDMRLHGGMTRGQESCDNPAPGNDVACGDVTITGLPTSMSMLIDSAKNNSRAEFHACDYRFFDATPACAPGTDGSIGVLAVDGHLSFGHPGGLGVLEPTTDLHALMQYRQPSDDDVALRARARLEKIRNVVFRQSDDGFDATYDLGDGTKPFEAKLQADTRTGSLPDEDGLKANAEVLITPLPQTVTVKMHGPGDGDNADPMKLTYDASSPIHVQAHAQVFRAASGNTPACGDDGTACATVDIQRVPSHLEATIGQTETSAGSGAVDHHTVVDIASNSPVGAKPDVIIDAIAGLPSSTPMLGSTPVRAHAELLGLPRYVTAHIDERVTKPGLSDEQSDLRKVSVRTCQLDSGDNCVSGTEDKLDSLKVVASNFLTRPLNFPAPNAGITEPLWATVTGRGNKFQAAITLVNIREVTYVNHQDNATKGFRVRVGDNNNLQARVDVEGLPLGNINFGNMAIQNATLDAKANVLVKPLPDDIRICLRESGQEIVPATSDPITDVCEDTAPFSGLGTLGHTPMSVAYRASVPITRIETNLDVALNGQDANAPGHPAIEARKLHGEVNIDNIPKSIIAHILTPVDDAHGNAVGDTRVVYDAPSNGPGLKVHFRASQTQGDSICQDPRPSATALCVGADLSNLPKHFQLVYKPDQLTDNFHAETDTDSPGKMNLTNLELSSVKPRTTAAGARIPGKADVLVATGQILGIDDHITVDGNINMPHDPNKAGSIDLTASIRIDEIDATVRNYIAPDPFTGAIPDRPVYKDPTSPSVLNTFTVRARPLPDGSPLFKAEAKVKNIAGLGYHQISDADGEPTGTSVLNVDFGKDEAARAYADVVLADGTHITGDVLLEHIPAGMQICFRGARADDAKPAASGQPDTFCDSSATKPEDGAFQFLGTPANPGLTGLDVDAFVRMIKPGGTDIVSGRVNITGIPYRVDGILPSEHNGGKLDIAGKNADGDPLGIKQIKFAAASFDLPSGSGDLNNGYSSGTPGFVPLTNQADPFPPATFATEYASVAANGDPSSGQFDFEAVGRIGDADDSVSSSRVQHIYTSSTACSNRDNRPDFPMLPTNDNVSTYRCIGADLQQTQPTVKDPFALAAVYKTADGNVIRLRNAGINDLPPWFQADIADTAKTQGANDALRRRCGTASAETAAYNTAHGTVFTAEQAAQHINDCMPPLLRFDQPLADARLFGVAEYGTPSDLETLAGVHPKEPLANLDSVPRGDGWGVDTGDTENLRGVRAKVVGIDGRTAARAAFRLPIPQSVTVDQVQTAHQAGQDDQDHYFDGSDLRFHFVVRNAAGTPTGSIGEVSALYQTDDGTQVMLSNPCAKSPHDRNSGIFDILNPYDCTQDWLHGIKLPGEVGLSMYTRNNIGTGQEFIRIDGRLSTTEQVGVRVRGSDSSIVGRVEGKILNIPGPGAGIGPDDATFRVNFLMKGDGKAPPSQTPPPDTGGDTPDDGCVLCVTTNVKLAEVYASFDFHPVASKPTARRVDATLHSDGAKNGMEVQSYAGVNGGAAAAVAADAYLRVDPLDIYGYLDLGPTLRKLADEAIGWIVDGLGLPGWVEDILDVVAGAVADLLASLVNLDWTFESRLDASLHIQSSHTTLRQNLLHVKVVNSGSSDDGSGDATISSIDLYVHQLKANANLGLTVHTPWPLPDINIGFTLLSIYYLPAASDIIPFIFKYLSCQVSSFWDLVTDVTPPLPGQTISAGPGETSDNVIWPLWDPRLLPMGGILGLLIDAVAGVPELKNIGGLFFCIPGADNGDIPLGPPGDTFQTTPGGLWPQHPIFDSAGLADSVLTPGAPGGIGAPPAQNDPPTLPPDPPAPGPNGPNWTVFANTTLPMCGLHKFGDLVVQDGSPAGKIRVATAEDLSNPTGTGPNCVAKDIGKLIITADNITNHGIIDGNAAQATQPTDGNPPTTLGTAATGNSGGGHGGKGGDGSSGTGGSAYAKVGNGDPEQNGAISEPGGPGAATSGTAPAGGGLVMLLANNTLTSDGTIRADGADGVDDVTTGHNGNTTSNACDHSEQTGTDGDGNPIMTHFDTGGAAAPAGGGAGGGVVLSATTLDLRGTTNGELTVKGGAGGDSYLAASGSGGGGVVKLLAPIELFDAGLSPVVSGGDGGAKLCPETTGGGTGAAGTVLKVATPTARAANLATFWHTNSVTVPFEAQAAYQNAGGFQVVLCGIHTSTTVAPANGTLFDLFTVPSSNTASQPCGSGASELATKTIPSGTTAVNLGDAAATITASLTGSGNNGLWGIYAVAIRPNKGCGAAPPDCAVSRLPQPEFDASTQMTLPAKVDTVFGIDNSDPTIELTAPGDAFLTKSTAITVSFNASDQDTPANQALSHIAKTECRNDGPALFTPYVSCASGSTFNLTPGNGSKTIQVRVTDGAGRTATDTVTGTLSNSPPTAVATIQFGPNGSAGWYTSAPTITITGYHQDDGVPAEAHTTPETGPFRYRFDSLPEQVCTGDPCVIAASAIQALPAGTHTFSFAAVDSLGNRLFGDGMQSTIKLPVSGSITSFKWDPDKTTTELDTVPAAPDKTVSGLGWYTTEPFVVLSALDALGGSGVSQTKYRVDGAGSFLTYNPVSPPRLGPGVHTVEYFSTDIAGNIETTHTSVTIRVDDAAPDSSISVSGGVLNPSGWYTTPPIVSVGGFDDHGGTGAPATGMLRYRVDNGNEISCDNPCNLASLVTGAHLVGLRAVDAAGNTQNEIGRTILVDTEAPHTTVALHAPAPDGLNSWYLSLPYVELSADDQPADYTHVLPVGSGVAFTQFQLDGGSWNTYTGPFQVAGDHLLCVRSVDVAGNTEAVDPAKCIQVKGDDKNPSTTMSVSGTPGLNSWYTSNATVTVSSSDPTPGSGLVQPGAVGTPCYDAPPAAPVPAGTCVSVDGRPFVPYTGAITLGEGVHRVQAFSVDAAGHRSEVVGNDVRIDKSRPVTTARTMPPYPAQAGWFRAIPRVVLRAADGDQNAGVAATYYKVDSGAFQLYTGPFDIQNGLHTVSYYSVDLAGQQEATRSFAIKVDTTPPIAIATNPNPALWLKLLGILGNLLGLSPPQAQLGWTVGDQYSGKLTVRVLVFDVLGNAVRQLDCTVVNGQPLCALKNPPAADAPVTNPITVTPGANVNGYTYWDGRDYSLTGILPIGLYYYRVVVTDEAGNVAQSGESKPIQIKAG